MNNRPGKPYAGTRLVKYLEKRILELRPKKTQIAIAGEAGFVNANMLAMIKSGTAKLPLDRVAALAKALECDPVMLFMLAIEQLGGDTTDLAVRQIFGTLVSENEVAWLEEIRRASDQSNPSLTSKARSTIRGIFGK
ncbi:MULTISPECIES: helix-turn-helix domain-containing protein [unclassified Mesorhizobium]|uniref:helix-turn-helix domain-containing protein n=1 Tax=unclassified Mesorhizobium TaxID=325217 RepID=UPI001CCE4B20|nr:MULTISPECIES: helix-turn-helix transcriptional regulator [unclassified Mesorhizobium]MBZ9916589.1 helix-turn-helix transcriptional regulator [Mesorhizobium sp. BR1-1-7]MBZ9952880.1 helix-turn-helix transcriptional regulator [Mesorhizobium sp. BR1-1-15]MBZ9972593.1 helix-turn-helix transcriptional regulator [Mesorhizobium sp. BR1-1-12]